MSSRSVHVANSTQHAGHPCCFVLLTRVPLRLSWESAPSSRLRGYRRERRCVKWRRGSRPHLQCTQHFTRRLGYYATSGDKVDRPLTCEVSAANTCRRGNPGGDKNPS